MCAVLFLKRLYFYYVIIKIYVIIMAQPVKNFQNQSESRGDFMLTEDRHSTILETVNINGSATLAELCTCYEACEERL